MFEILDRKFQVSINVGPGENINLTFLGIVSKNLHLTT